MSNDPKEQAANAFKWIRALRRTKVKQGIGLLGDKDRGYCCLGYGCKLLHIPYAYQAMFSEDFRAAVGLRTVNGKAPMAPLESLTRLNDVRGHTFKQIGDHLLAHTDEYFEYEVAKNITRIVKSLDKPRK